MCTQSSTVFVVVQGAALPPWLSSSLCVVLCWLYVRRQASHPVSDLGSEQMLPGREGVLEAPWHGAGLGTWGFYDCWGVVYPHSCPGKRGRTPTQPHTHLVTYLCGRCRLPMEAARGASTCIVKYTASRSLMSCQGVDRESQKRWLQTQVLETQLALGIQRMKSGCFHSDRGRSRGRKSCPGTGFP